MDPVSDFITRAFKYKEITLTWVNKGIDEIGVDQNGTVRVVVNSKYYRPCEVELLLGDPEKAFNVLKWTREYDLTNLIADMFN